MDGSQPLYDNGTTLYKPQRNFLGSKDELQRAMSCLVAAAKYRKKLAEYERKAAVHLRKWSDSTPNRAFEDIGTHLALIFDMLSTEDERVGDQLTHHSENLNQPPTADDELSLAARAYEASVSAQKKVIKSPPRQTSPSQHMKANEVVQRAKKHMQKCESEQEIVKMYLFRKGMKGIADVYMDHSSNIMKMFSVFSELTELVPALGTEDVRDVRYYGGSVAKTKMSELVRSLDPYNLDANLCESRLLSKPVHRRRSAPVKMGKIYDPDDSIEPPPPYDFTVFTGA